VALKLRIFPRSPWRVVALVVVGIAVIVWRIAYIWPPTHLNDYADVHPDQLEDTFNFNYAWLRERYGVDVRLILLNDPTIVDLDTYALNQARRLHVGDRESGQGVLVASHLGPLFSTPFTWAWEVTGDVYDSVFADVFYPVDGGVMRLRPGNNRPLPVRRTRWE
jgi:hypothetical protein